MLFVRFLSLFCLLSFVSSTDAGLFTAQQFVKDGRVILICGDLHDSLDEEKNQGKWSCKVAAQWKGIVKGLDSYKKCARNKKPLSVLYELNGSEINRHEELKKTFNNFVSFDEADILSNFPFYQQDHVVKCIDIERRGFFKLFLIATDMLSEISASRPSQVISTLLSRALLGNGSSKISIEDEFRNSMEYYRALQNQFLQISHFLKNRTLSSILNNYEMIFKCAQEYADTSISQVVDDLYGRYKKARETFLKNLSLLEDGNALNKNDELFEYCVTAMINISPNIAKKLKLIINAFIIDGSCLVNDLATVWYIHKKVDHNIAVFVGDTHRKNVAHELIKLGYTCEKMYQVHSQSFESSHNLPNVKEEINNLLNPDLITRFIRSMVCDKDQHASTCYSDKQEIKQTCASCGIDAKTRCSKCKKVYYCSQECQREDWKNHKQVCNK